MENFSVVLLCSGLLIASFIAFVNAISAENSRTFFFTFRFPSTSFEARIDNLNGCSCIIFVEIIFLPSLDNLDFVILVVFVIM